MSLTRILLVDDEDMVLRVLKTVIGSSIKSDISTASSGQEALDLMETNRFDVVVADMKMPGMSGA